ncbi:MAG TPA: HAMP domain-containing sensor histidine kinase [Vicinamibacteria bacterium]|nr:HAMP domain-containing sensor histidine kinase [Vicinamibacteria bacterium]
MPSSLTLGAVGLVGLLTLLAVLQYRWVGELSEAELERLRASAHRRAVAFAEEFDRELTRAFLWFTLAPSDVREGHWQGLVRASERWRSSAPHPGLVKGLYVVRARKDLPPDRLALDPAAGRVVTASWPSELAPLLARLENELAASRAGRERPAGSGDLIDEETPALVITALDLELTPEGRLVRRRGGAALLGFTVVLLDLSYLHDGFLPALERRYFDGADGFDYSLQVFTSRGPQAPFYTSPGAGSHPEPPDASARILDLRFDARNRDLLEGVDPTLEHFWKRRFGIEGRSAAPGHRPPSPGRPPGGYSGEGEGRWRVALWNRAGGLAEVVTAARRRNLGVSFGVLILLGTSVILLVTAASRAERLAGQQMEFVAGVTHELRTPLAVIRSAGENLADGLVKDKAQVCSYGALVRDEGRRLSEMVEQVLELAGAESGRPPAPRRLLHVGRLVDDALASCDPALRAAGVRLEREVPAELPLVLGDEAALRRMLRNLFDNAIKYGGDSPWLGIRARAVDGGREVLVTVEDHGLGIAPEDLPRIFEPFYRGRHLSSQHIHGSGLGLSLVRRIVESHGGRVVVERGGGGGSAFTIRLPAQREAAPVPSAEGGHEEANPAR